MTFQPTLYPDIADEDDLESFWDDPHEDCPRLRLPQALEWSVNFNQGVNMRQMTDSGPWVVYETPATARMHTMKFVCEEVEWEQLKRDNPGWKLVRSGIANEGEAEQAARDGTEALRSGPRKY